MTRIVTVLCVWLCLGNQLYAQTATIDSLNDQSCAGTRFGSNLNCTSNDFTASLTFTQPALTAISECVAGETIFIDVIANVQSNSPRRYDGAFFLGQSGNDPRTNNASNLCSLGVFPTTPTPFLNIDADVCGDFESTSNATLLMRNTKIICQPATGTNLLSIPYLMVFNNQTGGSSCTAANITANTKAKCVSETDAVVLGVVVQGYIEITKSTDPSGDLTPFNFTTSTSPSATTSPSSFSISDGQTQRINVPLEPSGGTQTLTLSETLEPGWQSNASITCTTPSGGDASGYVTIDNTNRTVTASLTTQDFGVVCTISNTKLPTLTVTKVSEGGVGNFSFSGDNGFSSQTISTLVDSTPVTGATQILNSISTATTIVEASTAGFSLTDVNCTGLGTGGNASVSLATRTVTLDTAATSPGSDIECTFTNGVPSHALLKSVDETNISTTTLLSYTIEVDNDGFVDLTGASLTDALTQDGNGLTLTSGPTLVSGDANANNILERSETWRYTATYSVDQANLDDANDLLNTATFSSDQTGQSTATATTTIAATPALNVAKIANDTDDVFAGQVITYTYTITNTGNQTIRNVSLSDSHGGNGSPPTPITDGATLTDNVPLGDSSNPIVGNSVWDILAPGDSLTITADYTVTQQDIDTLQ